MNYHKDIAGIAIKNTTIEQRKQIFEICSKREIPTLLSIKEPNTKSMKAHPHVQYHSNLVDSFRGKHPKFVSFEDFIKALNN